MIFRTVVFSLFFFYLTATAVAETPDKTPMENTVPGNSPEKVSVSIPDNIDDVLEKRGLNWLEEAVNRQVIASVKKETVILSKIAPYLYIQVIPFFAYQGPKGEQHLRDDITMVLGTVKSPSDTQMMPLPLAEMAGMGLPFRKKITDSMVLPKLLFPRHIDITFFVDVNMLTGRVADALEKIPGVTTVYNSKNRFYRIKKAGSDLRYFVHIPNVAYEMTYTGRILETILKREIREVTFLSTLLEQYEKKLKKKKDLSWNGRYIKGKKVYIDLLYLFDRTNGDTGKAKQLLQRALAGKKVDIRSTPSTNEGTS